jgi:hypothetical protein
MMSSLFLDVERSPSVWGSTDSFVDTFFSRCFRRSHSILISLVLFQYVFACSLCQRDSRCLHSRKEEGPHIRGPSWSTAAAYEYCCLRQAIPVAAHNGRPRKVAALQVVHLAF